jgi:hypothetical protein
MSSPESLLAVPVAVIPLIILWWWLRRRRRLTRPTPKQ